MKVVKNITNTVVLTPAEFKEMVLDYLQRKNVQTGFIISASLISDLNGAGMSVNMKIKEN